MGLGVGKDVGVAVPDVLVVVIVLVGVAVLGFGLLRPPPHHAEVKQPLLLGLQDPVVVVVRTCVEHPAFVGFMRSSLP